VWDTGSGRRFGAVVRRFGCAGRLGRWTGEEGGGAVVGG
jgi:hypothetical protein